MKTLKDKSVLIVDDDLRILRALDRVLAGEGASVIEASWGGDALDLLTERRMRVDLVITDLRMPFVSGMTVVYAIHKILPALPIIVLTAFGSPDVKAECFRQGASAFLEKPLNSAELLEAIATVLGRTPAPVDPARAGETEKTKIAVENADAGKTGLMAGALGWPVPIRTLAAGVGGA